MRVVYKRMSGELLGSFGNSPVPREGDKVLLDLDDELRVFVVAHVLIKPIDGEVEVHVGRSEHYGG